MSDIYRLVAAVILSVAVLFGWDFYMVYSGHKPVTSSPVATSAISSEIDSAQNDLQKAHLTTCCTMSRRDAVEFSQKERLSISSPTITGSVMLRGLKIDDISLKNYKESLDENSDNIALLSPIDSFDPYVVELIWSGIDTPTSSSLWKSDVDSITSDKKAHLTWENAKGVVFSVVIELDEKYMFSFLQSAVDKEGNDVKIESSVNIIKKFSQNNKQNKQPDPNLIVGVSGSSFFSYNFDSVMTKPIHKSIALDGKNHSNDRGWFGFTDKYWLISIINQAGIKSNLNVERLAQDALFRGTVSNNEKFNLFVGPKELSILDDYSNIYNIFAFDRSVDFGLFYFITKPLLKLLLFIKKLTNSIGISILLLTVLVRIALLPFANKSYRSMEKMRIIQPKIDEIKKRNNEDKMTLNKEMFTLFQQTGVNPMSGCIPILIQIPVFFALYKVLGNAISMRHAPFFGWIKDLSASDPTNVFSLLDFTGLQFSSMVHIGIWPIIFGITMIVQQKSQTVTDSTQAAVMRIMPFIFIFMFSSFPVGLIVYWTWNNILSVVQQRSMVYLYRGLEK